jgi:putative transposase
MNQRTIYDQELFAHFVTFSCYRRRRLLDHDQPKRLVLGMLGDQLQRQSAKCVGFVVMPDHEHAIVWFPETGQPSRFMHGWKRRSSYEIHKWQERVSFRYLTKTTSGDYFRQRK